MGGVIGRSITTGDFVASVVLDTRSVDPDEIVGLAALGDRANSTGIALIDGQLILWNRERDQQKTLATVPAPKSRNLHLQFTSASGRQYQFAYSEDGWTWLLLEPQLTGVHLPPWDRAVRVGLTVGGVRGAEARFDSIKILPTTGR